MDVKGKVMLFLPIGERFPRCSYSDYFVPCLEQDANSE